MASNATIASAVIAPQPGAVAAHSEQAGHDRDDGQRRHDADDVVRRPPM
jgi:hypothetical protein